MAFFVTQGQFSIILFTTFIASISHMFIYVSRNFIWVWTWFHRRLIKLLVKSSNRVEFHESSTNGKLCTALAYSSVCYRICPRRWDLLLLASSNWPNPFTFFKALLLVAIFSPFSNTYIFCCLLHASGAQMLGYEKSVAAVGIIPVIDCAIVVAFSFCQYFVYSFIFLYQEHIYYVANLPIVCLPHLFSKLI